jgi:hypothetical protein
VSDSLYRTHPYCRLANRENDRREDSAMALKKRGKHRYGDSQLDIREEISRFSIENKFLTDRYADSVCKCGGRIFGVQLDDEAGAALRTCAACGDQQPIADSGQYLDEAKLVACTCPCGMDKFEVTVGVSLYENSDDVRWLYLGFRCTSCGLTAVYGNWKNEFTGYKALLAMV